MREFHNGAQEMARSLATYINSPTRIKREVDATFDTDMSLGQIKAYRTTYERKVEIARREAREPIDLSQTARDVLYAGNMARASNALAERINALRGHRKG